MFFHVLNWCKKNILSLCLFLGVMLQKAYVHHSWSMALCVLESQNQTDLHSELVFCKKNSRSSPSFYV